MCQQSVTDRLDVLLLTSIDIKGIFDIYQYQIDLIFIVAVFVIKLLDLMAG